MDHISLDLDLEDPATLARLMAGDLLVRLIVRDRRKGVKRQAVALITARLAAPKLGLYLTMTIPRLGSQVVAERLIVPWKETPDFTGEK